MKTYTYIILLSVVVLFTACGPKNQEKVVMASYADGKPKLEYVYILTDKGDKQLYKETQYFPEEKKYIEGTYDQYSRRDGEWTSWYENGRKNSQGTYENGLLQGKYTVWHLFPTNVFPYTFRYLRHQKCNLKRVYFF